MDEGSAGLINLLVLGAGLFAVGLVGLVIRPAAAMRLVGGGLMMLGISVTAVGFGRCHGNLQGQALAVFALGVGAVQAALGLALGLSCPGRADDRSPGRSHW